MTVHQRIDDDRAEAARADISEGLFRYLVAAVEIMERIDHVADLHGQEAERVAAILRRDRDEERAEQRRAEAEVEVAAGRFVNLDDTVVRPTPEQMASGAFRPYTVDKRKGSVRSVTTVRRVLIDRLVNLHSRGVLDDDTFAACVWYRATWERAGLNVSSGVSQWRESIRGKHEFGLMARSEIEAEARHDFRFARGSIHESDLALFDLVVLDELTINEAAKRAKVRFYNAVATFKHAAIMLHGGISHLLPVRQL